VARVPGTRPLSSQEFWLEMYPLNTITASALQLNVYGTLNASRGVDGAAETVAHFVEAVQAKFHYAIWSEPVSNQLRTSFEPDSVIEFGREPASSC